MNKCINEILRTYSYIYWLCILINTISYKIILYAIYASKKSSNNRQVHIIRNPTAIPPLQVNIPSNPNPDPTSSVSAMSHHSPPRRSHTHAYRQNLKSGTDRICLMCRISSLWSRLPWPMDPWIDSILCFWRRWIGNMGDFCSSSFFLLYFVHCSSGHGQHKDKLSKMQLHNPLETGMYFPYLHSHIHYIHNLLAHNNQLSAAKKVREALSYISKPN